MDEKSEVQKRIEILKTQLEGDIRFEVNRAKFDHWASMILMFLALASSGVAGIGGLLEVFTIKQTGAIALLPSILALIATTLKFEGKSAWHYRKKNRLEDLRDQLILQLPEIPTLDQIAALSKKRSNCIKSFQDEWEPNFPMDWSNVQNDLTPQKQRIKDSNK